MFIYPLTTFSRLGIILLTMQKLDLTNRQIAILKAVVEEYTVKGEPVGSELIEKKYKIGASPATIRNEMVELAKKGYLSKSYFSSGRIPTAKAFRFYINHLLKPKELSTAEEVSLKNNIWDERKELHRLLKQATRTLSESTKLLSISITDEGDFYYSGFSNILLFREFLEKNDLVHLVERFEDESFWARVLRRIEKLEADLMYLLGEEDFPDPMLHECASVFAEFEGENVKGAIGVVGPKRMYYGEIMPKVKYLSSLISEILRESGY